MLSSCKLFLAKCFYGINKPRPIDTSQIVYKYTHSHLGIIQDYAAIGVYQDLFYDSILNSESKPNYLFKPFIQPLSAMYFDSCGKLVSILVNCYAPLAKRTLDWSDSNRLHTFPPLTHTHKYDLLHFHHVSDKFHTLKGSIADVKKYDYTVIISWNRFMKRQTKEFIKQLNQNIKVAKDKNYRIRLS
jgi:hypothetical protein